MKDETNYKFSNGATVRIIASGAVGNVIDHRADRDDGVNTLVQWKDGQKQTLEQWCRETELAEPRASESEKATEKATGVATGAGEDLHESGKADARPTRMASDTAHDDDLNRPRGTAPGKTSE
jgi:hypothetical protein